MVSVLIRGQCSSACTQAVRRRFDFFCRNRVEARDALLTSNCTTLSRAHVPPDGRRASRKCESFGGERRSFGVAGSRRSRCQPCCRGGNHSVRGSAPARWRLRCRSRAVAGFAAGIATVCAKQIVFPYGHARDLLPGRSLVVGARPSFCPFVVFLCRFLEKWYEEEGFYTR